MKTSDFYYDLPPELIAQTPIADRSASRLLVYQRAQQRITDGTFTDILQYLRPGDVLVRNTTRVLPARLHGHRPDTGGALEFLLLKRLDERRWECLVRPGRRAREGRVFTISDELQAVIRETTDAGGRVLEFLFDCIFEVVLERVCEMPLPPFIT